MSSVRVVIRGLDTITESNTNDFFQDLNTLIKNAGLIYEVED